MNNIKPIVFVSILILLINIFELVAPFNAAFASQKSKPNIVFILADDLGFADLKCYGHPCARTPNLDKLATEGTRFTQFYMPGVNCGMSRTGLMTGKFLPTFQIGKRVTITEILKKQGYITGHFGKWHLGKNDAPGTYGIDTIETDFPGSGEDERGRDASKFDAAIEFIKNNKDGPFFVNVWGSITHVPINPSQEMLDRFGDLTMDEADFSDHMQYKFRKARENGKDVDECMRSYLAEVYALDECVGRLLDTIDELGLRDNTIIVFSSDQGPEKIPDLKDYINKPPHKTYFKRMGYAGEFRGSKHNSYEGGVRVPFIIRWPGHVPANRVDEKSVIGGIDWLPTLCSISGAEIDKNLFDGEDVSDIWLGKQRDRTKPLFWFAQGKFCIREGKWKFFLNGKDKSMELYDLSVDPQERKNVAGNYPDVVNELSKRINSWKATLPIREDVGGYKINKWFWIFAGLLAVVAIGIYFYIRVRTVRILPNTPVRQSDC